jgi:hypothetical protein
MNDYQNIEVKDRWNYHVGFEFPAELQHNAEVIELMVNAADLGAENLNMTPNLDGTLHHRSGRVILWLHDDVDGKMMKAIRNLQEAQPIFAMRVGLCGDLCWPELEEYVFTGCQLECLQHSLFSYEKTHETIKLKAYEPDGARASDGYTVAPRDGKVQLEGFITNASMRSTSMKLLQISFTAMAHQFFTKHD